MSIVINTTINKSAKLGIWKITENESWYFNHERVTVQVKERIDMFKSIQRKLQSISVFLLADHLLNSNGRLAFDYSENGKPIIANSSKQISVSHSGSMVAVMISEKNNIGVDIEIISDKIEKVSGKILNEKELEICNSLSVKDQHEFKQVLWGAKESMFKLYSIGDLDFKKNMYISSFIGLDRSFTGIIKKGEYHEIISGNFMNIEGYMLVYVFGHTAS